MADNNTGTDLAGLPVSPNSNIFCTHQSFNDMGKRVASQLGGYPVVFQPALHKAYGEVNKIVANDERERQKYVQQINEEITRLQGEKEGHLQSKDSLERELKQEEAKIDRAKADIQEIKDHPEKLLNERGKKPSRVAFFISLGIILVLTVYLFVFYSSTAYSAFFRNFSNELVYGDAASYDIGATKAIFDSKAIVKASNDGKTELILILTIPAIFLALGYLIHRFTQNDSDKKRYWKVGALVLVTFVFDAILAYSITKKGYDFWLENIVVDPQEYPLFNMSEAVQSSDFWMVIFSGFVVYIIWGLLFNFVMEEYYKLNIIQVRIKGLEKNIQHYKDQCNEIKKNIKNIDEEIGEINTHIKVSQSKLNQPPTASHDMMALEINNFTTGWLAFMQYSNFSETHMGEVTKMAEDFLKSIPKDNKDTTAIQNTTNNSNSKNQI